MTETPQAPMPETMLPISQTDLDKAGFPASAPMAPGLAVFFNDALYLRCRSLAVIMAEADGVMPKHLIGRPQACFAIISRAITWNLDPYAVAMCTYQTPGGSIGFEGKLVQAILEASGRLVGGVKYTHVGDWSKVKGKFQIIESPKGGKYPSPRWTREDAAGLTVIVSAQVKGENQPRELTFDLETAFPLNSPLWATAPERQVCYTAVRAFANQAMPGVLMGLPFDYEEPLSAMATIAPPRPQKKGAAEFDRTQEAAKADTKFSTTTAKPDAPKANGEAKSEVAETVAAKDEVKAEVVKPAEPAKAEPELPPIVSSTAPAEREPGDDSATIENLEKRVDTLEKTAAEELAQWYRDQVAEIGKSATIKDLAELRDMVVQNVDDTQAAEFKKLCGARAGVILNGELVETKTVKQVTDLRGKYTAVLGSEMGQWFNKLCDDRQRAILEATRKARQK